MTIASTLHLAAQALRSHQAAIQTTGHNLANIATPGFSRQRVELTTGFPSTEGGVVLGQGSHVAAVQRVIDRFLEAELLSVNRNLGHAEAQNDALAAVQDVFPTTGGIDAALSAFFGALADLANHPAGVTERITVIGKAKALGESLRQTREGLTLVQRNLDHEIDNGTQRLNLLLEDIARLNGQIELTEINGAQANDLRDGRQLRLQEVARLTGATIREEADGNVTVIAGGLLLVGGQRFASLTADDVDAAGFRQVSYRGPDGLEFNATALVTGGKIGSLINMRDTEVQQLIDALDQIAQTLVTEVNARHAQGFDLTGAAGGDFFAPIAATAGAAGIVRVDAALAADPRRIAAASDASALPGDNRNALALVDLQSATFPALAGLTLQDSFLSLVGDIGSSLQTVETRWTFSQRLLTEVQSRREAVSGVNVDEELTRLILFQRAFEASSLLLRTANELYGSVIEMVR